MRDFRNFFNTTPPGSDEEFRAKVAMRAADAENKPVNFYKMMYAPIGAMCAVFALFMLFNPFGDSELAVGKENLTTRATITTPAPAPAAPLTSGTTIIGGAPTAPASDLFAPKPETPVYNDSDLISKEQATKIAKEIFMHLADEDAKFFGERLKDLDKLIEVGNYNVTFQTNSSANVPIWRVALEHKDFDMTLWNCAWINALTGESIHDLSNMTARAAKEARDRAEKRAESSLAAEVLETPAPVTTQRREAPIPAPATLAPAAYVNPPANSTAIVAEVTVATSDANAPKPTPPVYDESALISKETAVKIAKEIFMYLANDDADFLGQRDKDFDELIKNGSYSVTFHENSFAAVPIFRVAVSLGEQGCAAWINAFTGESIYDLNTMTARAAHAAEEITRSHGRM